MIQHQAVNSMGNYSYNLSTYENIFWDYHFHKNYEVIYVCRGQVECVVSSRRYVLEAGDFALCLSNEVHYYKSVGDSLAWVCVFSSNYVPRFDKAVQNKVGENSVFRCEDTLCNFLNQYIIEPKEPQGYLFDSCLYAICGEYLRQVPLIEKKEKGSELINDIVDYISTNYKRDINLAVMAEEFGYNYYYFSKIFKKTFLMSFTEYLNTYRFNAAAELLIETDNSITDIAMESGFQSLRTFNDVFQRMAGVSPAEYRKSRG